MAINNSCLCSLPLIRICCCIMVETSWQSHFHHSCMIRRNQVYYHEDLFVKIYFIGCTVVVVVTPLTLGSGGSPIFPLMVHQPASASVWPAVPSHRRGLSTTLGMTTWCVCGCSWRYDVRRVCGCNRWVTVVMYFIWVDFV